MREVILREVLSVLKSLLLAVTILWILHGIATAFGNNFRMISTLAHSHAVMWVELDIQKRHLNMLGRSHDEITRAVNKNTESRLGEAGKYNLEPVLCYSCHD